MLRGKAGLRPLLRTAGATSQLALRPPLHGHTSSLMKNGRPFLLAQHRDSVSVGAALFGISGAALVAKEAIKYGTIWWNTPRAPKRYKGGFEEEITRREAALILGVRESAEKKAVMAAYKKIMLLNHPDLVRVLPLDI